MVKLKEIFNSNIIKFVSTKYLAFGLQVINSFLVAKKLGVYYFGIYGFATMLLQYLSYTNFGVNYALNVILSTNKEFKLQSSRYLSNSILLTFLFGLLVLVLIVPFRFTGFFADFYKYKVDYYIILIGFLAILQNVNIVFISIYRIYAKLNEVNYFYLTVPLISFFLLIFAKGEVLFYYLLYGMLIGNFVNFTVFYINSPTKIIYNLDKNISLQLLKRGLQLLFYNLSFYLILLSARTIVSKYFNVEEFAFFNFSIGFITSTVMFIESINFLFFSKMLNKFSKLETINEIRDLLSKIRELYLPFVIFTLFGMILILPLIFIFLPKYYNAFTTIGFLSLYQLFNANNFGFTILLLQKKKENYVTFIGFLSIGLFILFSLIGIKYFNVGFSSIGLILALVMMMNNFLVPFFCSKLVLFKTDIKLIIKDSFNFKMILPFLLCVVFLNFNKNYFFVVIFFITFILLNYKILIKNIRYALNLIKHNEKLELE